jgi:hypothetical protein
MISFMPHISNFFNLIKLLFPFDSWSLIPQLEDPSTLTHLHPVLLQPHTKNHPLQSPKKETKNPCTMYEFINLIGLTNISN